MGSKDAPQKMQFLGAIKELASLDVSRQNARSGGKTPQILPPQKQNRFESQCSCIFQEPMNRGKYEYVGL